MAGMSAQQKNTGTAPACSWIHPVETVGLKGKKLILFGAGRGSEEFLTHQQQLAPGATILAITDNDASLWGKTLEGHQIIPPDQLSEGIFDTIVVTSISGRDAIAGQLEALGFRRHDDFILIGRYPNNPIDNFQILLRELGDARVLNGSNCLHIGPGGFLGIETLLHCLGAAHVHSIDKFSFAIDFPDVTDQMTQYLDIEKSFSEFTRNTHVLSEMQRRFTDLFPVVSERIRIDKDKIAYHYPVDVCELPFSSNQFDLVLSFAVLEHVLDPTAAVRQLIRVLRPGGLAFHRIITRDHRSFSSIQGFSPFSFRSYSQSEWQAITTRKFPQNRLLPVEWKKLFEQHGLTIQKYQVSDRLEITQEEYRQFHGDFYRFSMEELGECDCLIMARK